MSIGMSNGFVRWCCIIFLSSFLVMVGCSDGGVVTPVSEDNVEVKVVEGYPPPGRHVIGAYDLALQSKNKENVRISATLCFSAL